MKLLGLFIMVSVALNANPITEFQQETRRQELINEAEATKANPPKTQNNKPILKPQTPKLDGQLSTNKITTINVTGNTLLTPYEIFYIITPFKNKSLKSSDIFRLISNVQRAYANRGYTTTRVSIQPSSNNQTIILEVTEGRIGRIYTKDNTWFDQFRMWQLFPTHAGGIANDFNVRHGVRQAQRLSNIQINTQLEPGFNLGETNILTTINTIDTPWSLTASFNNAGSNAFVPSYLQLTGNHLLRLFDQWHVSYAHSINDFNNSTSITIKGSVPYRRHLFSGSITNLLSNQYTQTFNESHDVLQTSNKKYYVSDTVTLHNNGTHTLSITPSLAIKRNNTTQNDVTIESQAIKQTLGGISSTFQINGPARITTTIGLEQTLKLFNAQTDPADIEVDAEHVEFKKVSASLQVASTYKLPIIKTTATTVTISGQTINSITTASEHAVLGGWYSVKGFNATPQFGEHYALLSTEQMLPLSQYPVPSWLQQRNIQLKWFGDAGIIQRSHNMAVSNSTNGRAYAIGTAVGIGLTLFNGQFDFKIAKGLASTISIPAYETMWSWSMGF